MEHSEALAALGHPTRLAVFRLLARHAPHGVRPTEISEALDLKQNTASVYLAALSRAGLVVSERDGRSIFYRIDLDRTGGLIDYLVGDCCRGRPELCAKLTPSPTDRINRDSGIKTDRVFKVLFICTGNSARSIFAEAIMNKIGDGRFRAYSAGTRPYSEINPRTIKVLERNKFDISTLRAKHVDEFRRPDAPMMDFVFTVCDRAANEECPPWPGQPVTGHWDVPDPVKIEEQPGGQGIAFNQAYGILERRISIFANSSIERLDRLSLQQKVDEIGRIGLLADRDAG